MFPSIFEWIWDMSHIVFMGGLWFSLVTIGMGLIYCIIRAVLDTINETAEPHQ